MGSWYKEGELGKRAAIFSASAQVATLFSGVLQAALYTNLNGVRGLAGWQWLFIICGVITIPIAACELSEREGRLQLRAPRWADYVLLHLQTATTSDGFFFFPDTPSTTSARYFSAEERVMAVARLPYHEPTQFNLSLVKRVLGRWHIYVFALIWVAGGGLEAFGTTSLHALWMQAQNTLAGRKVYTIREINYYPTGATAVSIVALLGTAMWTDRTGKRWHANVLVAACLVVSASILLAYEQTSVGAKFFAFYLSGVSYAGQATNFSWANEVLRFDTQERSVVLAAMNVASYAVNIAVRPRPRLFLTSRPCPTADLAHCLPSPRAAVGRGFPGHGRALLQARHDLDHRLCSCDRGPFGRRAVAPAEGPVQTRRTREPDRRGRQGGRGGRGGGGQGCRERGGGRGGGQGCMTGRRNLVRGW